MQIKESAEDYLEAILMISKQREKVRAADICAFFGYSRPSVSVAVKQFRVNGYINVDDDNAITLTDKGEEIAVSMYERHQTIAGFFKLIGVDETNAFDDACRVEHCISDVTFGCIKEHLKKMTEEEI